MTYEMNAGEGDGSSVKFDFIQGGLFSKAHALRVLNACFPAQNVLWVGSHRASVKSFLEDCTPKSIRVIDADEVAVDLLSRAFENNSSVEVELNVVAAEEGEVSYYQASLKSEDGLVDPTFLMPYWKNIRVENITKRRAVTIDSLVDQRFDRASAPNWLIVNCLPAELLLRGAARLLETIDVLIVRVVLAENADPRLSGATLSGLLDNLKNGGWILAFTIIESNPSFGLAVFSRDWKKNCESRVSIEVGRERERSRAELEKVQRNCEDLANELNALREDSDAFDAKGDRQCEREVEKLKTELGETESRAIIALEEAERAEKRRVAAQKDLEDLRSQFRALKEEQSTTLTRWRELRDRLADWKAALSNEDDG